MGDQAGQEQPRKGDNQPKEEQVPAQEKEAEDKEKKDVEPEKEKEMETQDDIKEGKETAEKMDSNTNTSGEDMKDNEKEDKVEAALKTMQAMGFSDDGGWLSSLLRAKSGDVGKVLDTIQPFKN